MLPDSYATMITPTRLANNAVVPHGLGVDVKNVLGHPAAAHGGSVEIDSSVGKGTTVKIILPGADQRRVAAQ